MQAVRASCEVRDHEGQEDEGRRKRDDEREHGGRDDRGRRRALALVSNLAEVRSFVHDRVDRVVDEALVRRRVGSLLVFHVAHDRV
jgi:hypothetical protein